MVRGLGGAFHEHLVYDANGQLLAGNLADYLIATARLSKDPGDCAREPPVTEQPTRGHGRRRGRDRPVVANAVANALTSSGAMPNQLPLSPARATRQNSSGEWRAFQLHGDGLIGRDLLVLADQLEEEADVTEEYLKRQSETEETRNPRGLRKE